jgi:translation initiation factor 1
MSNSRLVYSSGDGDQRKRVRKPAEQIHGTELPKDGVVRIFRGKGGRGGKAVSVVRGLPRADLDAVAKDLKKHCGSGGTVKDGAVEIQGDHREKIAERLQAQGYVVKLAGG